MPRNLTTQIQAEIVKDVLRPVYLLHVNFEGYTLRCWSGQGDLSYDSVTWKGEGLVTRWPTITESLDLQAHNITLDLSGNYSYPISISNPELYRGKECEVFLGFLTESGDLTSDKVYRIFNGRVSQVSFVENTITDTFKLSLESRLVDLAKSKNSRYTHQSQIQRYAGDMGLEYAGRTQKSLFLSRGETPDKPFSRKIVYGATKVDGSPVFVATSGAGSRYLNLVVAVADHPCESLDQIYLDDRPVLDGSGNVSGEFVGVVEYTWKHGWSEQLVATNLQTEVGSTVWTNDHRLRGIAYIYLKILYSEDLFGDAAPQVSAKIQGRKLYDPRDASFGFSNNPALAIRDFLISEEYGFSAADSELDDVQLAVAANDCDYLIDKKDDTNEKRYTVNGWLDTAESIGSNLAKLKQSMAGHISYMSGSFGVYAGVYALTNTVISDDEILDSIDYSNKNLRESYNGAKGVYRTPDLDWQEEEYPPYQLASAVTLDGEERWLDLSLPLTTSAATAQRISKISVTRSRAVRQAKLTTNLKLLDTRCGDVISLNTAKSDVDNYVYLVNKITISLALAPSIQFELIEVSSSDYAWDEDTEETELTTPEQPANSILAWTLARLSAPSASPASQTFTIAFNATVSHNESGVTCRYTTDGTDPDENDPSIANGGVVNISGQDVTLKLKSFQNGGSLTSDTVTYEYTYSAPTNQVATPNYTLSKTATSVYLYFTSAENNTTMYTSVNGGSSYTTHGDADTDEPKLIAQLNQNWTPSNYRAYCTKAGYLDSNQLVIPNKCIQPYTSKEFVSGRWKLILHVFGTNATLWMRSRDGSLDPWGPWESGTGYNWGDSPSQDIWLEATSGPDPDYEFYVSQSGWDNSDVKFVDRYTNT